MIGPTRIDASPQIDFPEAAKKLTVVIVSDAWKPQMNGVVRTLEMTANSLRSMGHEVHIIGPDSYFSLPCPTYPEIRLALVTSRAVGKRIENIVPDAVHISTEGPLGLAARRYCLRKEIPFTTAFHTQFPEYLSRRTGVSSEKFWSYIRWFHGPSNSVMAATDSITGLLLRQGIGQVHRWSRGVDLGCFNPAAPQPPELKDLQGPILLYVGRIAVEKNLEAFLSCDYPGTKVVVGDGPQRAALQARFPYAEFVGKRTGTELAGFYASADVFVFPSQTDTFGLVMIEALACGTPVAAFPAPGPRDIVRDNVGALSDDLCRAIDAARYCSRSDCAAYGQSFNWENATAQFLSGLSVDRQKRIA